MPKQNPLLDYADPARKSPDLCLVKHCRKPRAKGRRICYCHHVKSWRLKNPDKSAYRTLKDHAKRRGIKFTLTFKQFLDVAVSSGYIDRKGNFADDLHLDRIDPVKGYEEGNLQVISCSENSRKGAIYDKQRRRQYAEDNLKRKYEKEDDEEERCPF